MLYKVAIIGTGHIAESHVNAFRRAGADVLAVVNPNMESAEAFAKKYSIPAYFDSMETLFSKIPNVEIVSICTPTKFHRDQAIKALRAGKHVYSEKPPAKNSKETKDIIKEAEKASKLISFAFNNRARPGSREMYKKITEGQIGKINSVEAVWARKKGIPGQGGWFTNKEFAGGGCAIDLIHMLDLALYMMKYPKPEYVSARNFNSFIDDRAYARNGKTSSKNLKMDTETSSHAFITFQDGSCLYSHTSWAEMVEDEFVCLSVQGDKGGAELTERKTPAGKTKYDVLKLISRDEVEKFEYRNDGEMGRSEMIDQFMKTLNGRAVSPVAKQSVILMKIIDAIYLSAKIGKPVKIEL